MSVLATYIDTCIYYINYVYNVGDGTRGTAADYERDVLRSGRRTTEFVSWTTRPVTPGFESTMIFDL